MRILLCCALLALTVGVAQAASHSTCSAPHITSRMMGSLGLTSTQQKATNDAFAAQHAADRRARQGVDGQIASILTPAQEQQFLAARTKRSQPRQYARILATLGLTASQMQATQGAIAQYDAASCQARQNLDQAINAVLTPAQQSQLQGEMKPKHVGRIR